MQVEKGEEKRMKKGGRIEGGTKKIANIADGAILKHSSCGVSSFNCCVSRDILVFHYPSFIALSIRSARIPDQEYTDDPEVMTRSYQRFFNTYEIPL